MNKEIGKELRIVRLSNNLSLRELGIKTGITFSRLGKFERGEEIPTKESIKKIELALELNFGELMKCSNETSQLFDSFIDSLFYHDDNNNLFKNKIKETQNNYKLKFECSKLTLIQYILFVLENNLKEAIKIEKELFEYFDIDDECKAILYEYKGLTCRLENQNEKAIKWLEKAFSMVKNDKNKAMISYHLCVPYMDSRRIIESMNCLKISERIFSVYGAFKRVSYCHLEYALLFNASRDYKHAIDYFNLVLKENEIINFPTDYRFQVHRNMCWTMILSENYLAALDYLEDAILLDKTKPNTILYGIWCNYKLGNYDEAEKIINENNLLVDNVHVKKYYQLFSSLVIERDKIPTKKVVDYTKQIISSFNEYEEVNRIIFYIDLLLDLLDKRNDEAGKNKYLEMKISLLK